MVKPTSSSSNSKSSSCSSVYRGVRKRNWGKYVSEIRLPNSRERIWLGSYDTPEKAARAFDAALFCLRGKSAKFNFPNNPPPEINNGCESLTPLQIQSIAAKFANDNNNIVIDHQQQQQPPKIDDVISYMSPSPSDISSPEYSFSSSSSTSTPSNSTAATTDDGLVPINDLPMDWSFLDFLSAVPESDNSGSINYESADFGDFTGLDDFPTDFFPPPPEEAAYVEDDDCNEVNFPYYYHQQESFLWNF